MFYICSNQINIGPAVPGYIKGKIMIIKELQLRNFQVIDDLEEKFDGNVYFITGDNELGKSTLLKAIGVLLTGDRDAVLQKGKDKGFARAVIGADGNEYKVELNFTAKNPRGTLLITDQNGMKTERLEMLQNIFGYVDYDAVEFSRWSETAEGRRKQLAVIKQLLPDNVRTRIDEIDTEIKVQKEKKTTVNSAIKNAIAQRDSIKLEKGDIDKYNTPIALVDLLEEAAENSKLVSKAERAQEVIKKCTAQLDAIPSRINHAKSLFENDFDEIKKRIEALQLEAKQRQIDYNNTLEQIDKEKTESTVRLDNARKWLDRYNDTIKDEESPEERLIKAEKHNEMVQKVNEYKVRQQAVVVSKELGERIDSEVAKLQEERGKLILSASLPIPGLSFTDEGLELNGVPFVAGKVSDSQLMEVATQLIIASNPKVKVFRIARGESLGENRLRDIIAIAKKHGFQGFIEEVKRGQNELVIEQYTEL